MADVSIFYKDSVSSEMDGAGSKTVKTAGLYCEGDIVVAYTPRVRTYEITLPKSSGWVLLTALDEDVLAHIDDDNFIATLTNTGPYEYVYYAGDTYFVTNKRISIYNGSYLAYGWGNRMQSETNVSNGGILLPANNREKISVNIVEIGIFALVDGRYYIRPGDGFIKAGVYRLTFTW